MDGQRTVRTGHAIYFPVNDLHSWVYNMTDIDKF
jgi:hypothetical protein